MSVKKGVAFLIILVILTSLSISVFAAAYDDPTNQDPSKLLEDDKIIMDAQKAVEDTVEDVETMGMSIYILIRAAGSVIGLIIGAIVFIVYMMTHRNTNKRADVLNGLGHFFAAFGGFVALGWIISMVYKFATGLTGGA